MLSSVGLLIDWTRNYNVFHIQLLQTQFIPATKLNTSHQNIFVYNSQARKKGKLKCQRSCLHRAAVSHLVSLQNSAKMLSLQKSGLLNSFFVMTPKVFCLSKTAIKGKLDVYCN